MIAFADDTQVKDGTITSLLIFKLFIASSNAEVQEFSVNECLTFKYLQNSKKKFGYLL